MVNYKIFFYFFIFLGISSSFAQEPNSFEYLKIKINNDIEFQAEVDYKTNINYFFLTSYFFPQTFENAQYLNSFESNHNKYQTLDNQGIVDLRFSYDENSLRKYNDISNQFVVESIVNRPEIVNKVEYPIKYLDSENLDYTEFIDLIDINEDIKTQASVLAKGEDDVYIIASKIAKWIYEDIDYDLSTVTQNPNQKSSEVFLSKSGVCKEITNLYISMMRSLGIPARVVTGFSYTDSEEVVNFIGSNWGGHAWAEVLIGDEWVPFDLTYNQYGFVDATHIILDKSNHIRENSVSINASGSNFKLVSNSLKTDTTFEIIEKEEKIYDSGYVVTISGNDKLGFGSYGFVKVDIENTDDFYKVLFLRLSKTEEVELLDSDNKMIIFEPNEKKEIYFRFKLPENLDSNFIYTFPFKIYNEFLDETYDLSVKSNYQVIKASSLPEEEIEEKTFSNNDLNFNCNFIFNVPYNEIICSVKNPNNYEVNNLEVCISLDNCEYLDLKLNEQKSLNFKTELEQAYLIYKHSKDEGVIGISLQKPNLNFEYSLEKNNLLVEYNLDNFLTGLVTKIFINDENLFESELSLNSEKFVLNQTKNEIKVELSFKGEIISAEKFEVVVDEKIIKRLYGNFFEKIWYKFLLWISSF